MVCPQWVLHGLSAVSFWHHAYECRYVCHRLAFYSHSYSLVNTMLWNILWWTMQHFLKGSRKIILVDGHWHVRGALCHRQLIVYRAMIFRPMPRWREWIFSTTLQDNRSQKLKSQRSNYTLKPWLQLKPKSRTPSLLYCQLIYIGIESTSIGMESTSISIDYPIPPA